MYISLLFIHYSFSLLIYHPFTCWWILVNSAAMNVGTPVSVIVPVFNFWGCIPRSGISGSYGSSLPFWGISELFSNSFSTEVIRFLTSGCAHDIPFLETFHACFSGKERSPGSNVVSKALCISSSTVPFPYPLLQLPGTSPPKQVLLFPLYSVFFPHASCLRCYSVSGSSSVAVLPVF